MDVNPYAPPAAAPEAHSSRATVIVPFDIGACVGQSIPIYFKNVPIIAAVTLAVFLPVELIKGYAVHASGAELSKLVNLYGNILIENIFGSLVCAALLPALAHNINTGQTLGLGAALSAGLRRWGAVFGARFIAGFHILVAAFLLVIPGVVVAVRLSLTDEIAVLEASPSTQRTLQRSKDLVRGHAWQVFAVALVGFIPTFVVGFAGGFISALSKSWIVPILAACVNQLARAVFTVMFLVAYLGLTRSRAPGVAEG